MAARPANQPSNSNLPANVPPELAGNSQYEILRELGRGGMGTVYLARNKMMDRLEVLKVVNKALLDRPGAVERFLREIRSAAKLHHVNVVSAYSVLQLGDVLALAMEYIKGEDLAGFVKAHGPLPVAQACYCAQQAALGLQHAFEKGMVHRDIKPHNLMLAREGNKHLIKVLDFGLAKATREKEQGTELTAEGAILGTPEYIAPEQSRDAAGADIRADIYSLGCTLYYLLTGGPPFKGGSLIEILLAHNSTVAPPVNQLRAEVPVELASVVAKMMAKDPAQRYQTPIEVAQALSPFIKAAAKKSPPKEGGRAPGAEGPNEKTLQRTAPLSHVATVTEGANLPLEPVTQQTVLQRRPPAAKAESRKKWLLACGGVAVLLLLGLVGMWASGLFKVKAKDGTIVPEQAESGPGQAPEVERGFVPLFNGKDLTGWKVFGGGTGNWRVEGGALVGSGPQSHLFSERGDYQNFHLRVEARINDRGNSGVYFRSECNPGFPRGYEAQINSTHQDPQKTGSLHGIVKILQPIHQPDAWFTMEIIANGDHIIIKFNGRNVVDHHDRLYTRGHFALQQHHEGTVVKFRKIEIKELTSSPPTGTASSPLFNGKDLTGWEGLPGYWHVENGALVGRCPPGRPAHTFLVSKKTYRDFDLHFQVRRKDGVGNSGVQFRSQLSDRAAFRVVGPQCEIDSADFNLPPGSLITEPNRKPLDVKAPQAEVARYYKDADFNDFHIRCVGQHVNIEVNGVPAVDGDFPLPAEGVIAWQIHGSKTPKEVTFRNIELTDLSR